jgi:hypothetical protein
MNYSGRKIDENYLCGPAHHLPPQSKRLHQGREQEVYGTQLKRGFDAIYKDEHNGLLSAVRSYGGACESQGMRE